MSTELQKPISGLRASRARSRWNRGEDPRLNKVSDALAAVAARGFSAARADRDAAMALVDEAIALEPADDYNANQRRMFRDYQRKVIQSAAKFQRDADEFSGKPVGNYDTTEPWVAREEARAKAEAEKAVLRQGLSAEDYWERNPTSNRVARITGTNEDGSEFYRAMPVMALERARQRDIKASEAERQEQLQKIENTRRSYADALRKRDEDWVLQQMEAKGIEVTDAVTTEDGRLDTDKARGLISRATFQQWDDDKMLDRSAKDLERRTKRELRYLEQAQEGRFGVGAQTQAMSEENRQRAAKLRADIDAGENDRGGLSRPGAWRRFAETELNNAAKQSAAVENLVQAANAQTMSYQDLAKSFGTTIEKIQEYLKDGVLSPEEVAEIFGQQTS